MAIRQTKRLGIMLVMCVFGLFEMMQNRFVPNERELQMRSLYSAKIHENESVDRSMTSLEVAGPPEENCWRKCPQGRKNIIYYDGDVGGLGDRKFVIHELAELAGYLCAHLIVPNPARLLTALHNNGARLHPDLQWEDMYNITFVEDNIPVIMRNVDTINENDYEGYLRVVSRAGTWKEDFKRIQEYSWEQSEDTKGFVWQMLYGGFYDNDLTSHALPALDDNLKDAVGHQYNPEVMAPKLFKLHGAKPGVCQYTSDAWEAIPSTVRMMNGKLNERIQELKSDASSIGSLHLRRGDALNDCDTRIDTVKKVLSCSLSNTEGMGNITIVFRSDELDEQYREDVKNLRNDFNHVQFLDMDYLVRQVVNEALESGKLHPMYDNNYFLYAIEQVGIWNSKFVLSRDRYACVDCTGVAELL
jgi:hypothetical protein